MILSKHIFWDVEASNISFDKDAEFIIPRVFQKGKLSDVQKILKYYEQEKLIKVLTNTRYLDKKTLALCCVIFNLQKEDFRCYTQKQFTQTPYNY